MVEKHSRPNECTRASTFARESAELARARLARRSVRNLPPQVQMPPQATYHKPTITKKQRVLDAYRSGRADGLAVPENNDINHPMAYHIAARDSVEVKPRGGPACALSVPCTDP
ncbi:hypothetical protein PC121_g19742 [Phytophthora cactorum]|nr:hypothetical protein PC120_g20166 [Phytophthora cactorum]KAG3047981.1 hypothetical protein PC121_g19742 [Phytophthora cactorum]KAG4043844.1 hypothetical protein PC123_g20700 [Phytophthora cactorum]